MKTFIVAVAIVMSLLPAQLASQDDTVYRPGDGVSLPKIVHQVFARYPQDAMRRRVNGSVFLECVVNREGLPTDVRVVKPLDEDIDREALKALSQWRFEPGKKDGKAVFVRLEVQMAFTMK